MKFIPAVAIALLAVQAHAATLPTTIIDRPLTPFCRTWAKVIRENPAYSRTDWREWQAGCLPYAMLPVHFRNWLPQLPETQSISRHME